MWRLIAFVILSGTSLTGHAACVDSNDPWKVVHAQDVAYNAHDPDAFVACYADDAVIEGLSHKRPPLVGKAAILEAYSFLKTAPKTFHTKFVEKIIVGPIVMVHEVAEGGPQDWPKPDWHKDSTCIFEVRNGKVVHVWFPPAK